MKNMDLESLVLFFQPFDQFVSSSVQTNTRLFSFNISKEKSLQQLDMMQ